MGAAFRPGDTVRRVLGVCPRGSEKGMFHGRLYQVAFQDRFLHLEGTVGRYLPSAFELVSRPEPKPEPEPIKVGDRVRILEIPGVTYGDEPGDGKGTRANGEHEDQGKVVRVVHVEAILGPIRAGGWHFGPEDLEKVTPAREDRDDLLTGLLRGFQGGSTDIVLTRDLITQLFERD